MVDNAFYDTHSDTTSEWYTPLDIYKPLDNEFHFVTDAAAEPTNRLRCKIFLTKNDNGLDISKWQGPVFINPPYSEKKYPVYEWLKAAHTYRNRTGNPVVMVLRSTTEVNWFQDFVWDKNADKWRQGVRVKFLTPRVNFVPASGNRDRGSSNSPTFATVIVIFENNVKKSNSKTTMETTPKYSSDTLDAFLQQQQL